MLKASDQKTDKSTKKGGKNPEEKCREIQDIIRHELESWEILHLHGRIFREGCMAMSKLQCSYPKRPDISSAKAKQINPQSAKERERSRDTTLTQITNSFELGAALVHHPTLK